VSPEATGRIPFQRFTERRGYLAKGGTAASFLLLLFFGEQRKEGVFIIIWIKIRQRINNSSFSLCTYFLSFAVLILKSSG
jgi:hypothetical protein